MVIVLCRLADHECFIFVPSFKSYMVNKCSILKITMEHNSVKMQVKLLFFIAGHGLITIYI